MLWLGPAGWRKSWWDEALDYNGDGRLAAMKHEVGIEWVTGHRLGSGHRYGSGRRYGSGCKSRFGYCYKFIIIFNSNDCQNNALLQVAACMRHLIM